VPSSWSQKAIYWPELSSYGGTVRDIPVRVFHDTEANGMSKENNERYYFASLQPNAWN